LKVVPVSCVEISDLLSLCAFAEASDAAVP
jgi:hypothetical protein